METNKEYCLEVWGSWACFTRPELKVERVSYDVITPSAGRAIFDAIFWKPAISWHVTKIEVLSPIKWTSIRRNEVGAVAKPKTGPIYIQDKRQQRNTLLLKDVHYRIHAVMHYKKSAPAIPASLAMTSHRSNTSTSSSEGREKDSASRSPTLATGNSRHSSGSCRTIPQIRSPLQRTRISASCSMTLIMRAAAKTAKDGQMQCSTVQR